MGKRTERVRVRLTPEELEHLKKCSGSFFDGRFQNGRANFSEYLRTKLLKESNYKNKALEQEIRNIRYELRKIGTNVNQIAKKINSGYGVRSDALELKQCLAEIEQAFHAFEEKVADEWQSQN